MDFEKVTTMARTINPRGNHSQVSSKPSERPVFDDQWMIGARDKSPEGSWARDVVEGKGDGQLYLSTLRSWFEGFPLTKHRDHLRNRLENFANEEHLGAVNEFAMWRLMKDVGLSAITLPEAAPDFHVLAPLDFYVEVTTLNLSARAKERAAAKRPSRPAPAHAEALWRVLGKFTDEKRKQLKYASDQRRPAVVAIFDYTEWSGYGTLFFRELGDFLVGTWAGFRRLPAELSALVYADRSVREGRIALSPHSSIYYNNFALHPLPASILPSLRQFSHSATSQLAV
jgi:hypothetical protein